MKNKALPKTVTFKELEDFDAMVVSSCGKILAEYLKYRSAFALKIINVFEFDKEDRDRIFAEPLLHSIFNALGMCGSEDDYEKFNLSFFRVVPEDAITELLNRFGDHRGKWLVALPGPIMLELLEQVFKLEGVINDICTIGFKYEGQRLDVINSIAQLMMVNAENKEVMQRINQAYANIREQATKYDEKKVALSMYTKICRIAEID